MKLVITRRVFRELVERLSGAYEVVHNEEDRPWPVEELASRMQGASGQLNQPHFIKELRRDIARVKTILAEKTRSAASS